MMKRFFQLLTLLLVVMFLIDFACGKALDAVRDHAKGGEMGKVAYLCRVSTEDLLVMGSSRACHQYNPYILEDSLHMSCLNAGKDGMGIIYNYALYRLICQRRIPRFIVYDAYVATDLFKSDNARYVYPLRAYYPQAGIDSVFWAIDPTDRVKMYSRLYRYNSSFQNLWEGVTQDPEPSHKGYSAYQEKRANAFPDLGIDYDTLKLDCLEKFVRLCKENGTRLIFVASPKYASKLHRAYAPLWALCKKYDVKYLDYYDDERFQASDFCDSYHLISSGADKFTAILAHDLKPWLKAE